MNKDLIFDVGQAYKLRGAFMRHNYTPWLIDALCEENILAEVRRVLLGQATINMVEHFIDCDADPQNPWEKYGWTVEEHQKMGTLKWDDTQVRLYLASGQKKGGEFIKGDELRKKLGGKRVLNASVLDYLLAHPELVPLEWEDKDVFFWGTIYGHNDGRRCVSYLRWAGGGEWRLHSASLGEEWDWYKPAAVLAS